MRVVAVYHKWSVLGIILTALWVQAGARDVVALFDEALADAVPDEVIPFKVIEGNTLNLHVFRPEDPPKAAILWIHGGGWQAGSADQLFPQAAYFARLGFLCVSADYRLATEGNTVFDCIADVRDAFYWMVEHAGTLGISPDKVVVAGESAGGHLAGCVGFIPDDRPDAPDPQPVPAACILVNPMIDIPAISWAMTKPGLSPDNVPLAEGISPNFHADAADPPTLFLHGVSDNVVPPSHSTEFAEALNEVSVPAKVRLWEGKSHAFFLYLPDLNLTDKPVIHLSLLEIEAFLQAERLNGYPVVDGHFSPVHLFSGPDGYRSFSELIPINGSLYGSTYRGGPDDAGILFRYEPNTRRFTVLHRFKEIDGREVFNGLATDGSTIWGVCKFGGSGSNGGTLFSIGTDGSNFQILYEFTNPSMDGFYPHAAPILHSGALYGTAYHGGETTYGGMLYKFTLPSGPFEVIHSFTPETGRHPTGQLLPIGDWLYGTACDFFEHDDGHHGSLYRIHSVTHAFEVLHRFDGATEGGHPYDRLLFDGDSFLYGSTFGQAFNPNSKGTLFRFDLSSQSLSVIHDFAAHPGTGSKPNGSLLQIDESGFLYGVSHGSNGEGDDLGTLFRLMPDGGNFTVLHRFEAGLSGNTPMRTPVFLNGSIYGTSVFGGLTTEATEPESGGGFIFRYTPVRSPSSARSSYIQWLADHGELVNQTGSANQDADSLNLLEEFTYGGDPARSDPPRESRLLITPDSALQLTADKVRSVMARSIQPLQSSTLQIWSPAPGFSLDSEGYPADPQQFSTLTWSWPLTILATDPLYLSLRPDLPE